MENPMMKADVETIKLPRRPSRRQLAYQMPRAANGRFQAVPKAPPSKPVDWNAIYEWRDAWRAHLQQVEAAKRETRWGGLRSIGLFTAISAVMIGMLIAGTMGA
jgi:hypothetical protein